MPYTIGELAKAAGISPRSVYVYAERHLIPAPLRQGRRFIYAEEHLEALRLVCVLLRLGLPTRQVEQLVVGREQAEIRRALAPVLPLARLLDGAEGRVTDLQRKVRAPVSDELDLADLGLEDPVWLRHELAEIERQRSRLQNEFDQAGAAVLRGLVGQTAPPHTPSLTRVSGLSGEDAIGFRTHLEAVAADLSDQLSRVLAGLEMMRTDTEREAFLAGLAAAHAAGWNPDPAAPPPTGLRPALVTAFQRFVSERGQAKSSSIAASASLSKKHVRSR